VTNRKRIAQFLSITLVIAVLFWLRAVSSAEYRDLSALNAEQKIEGFVPIGHFGESWPARIVAQTEEDDRIEFRSDNGQRHIYQGFEGYRLKMIRLHHRSGAEVIAVYRSEPSDKRPEREQNDKPIIKRRM